MVAPTISTVASYHTHQEYSVDFFGDEFSVTVTRTPAVIRRWIHNVLFFNHRFSSHPLVVGVGVQWTPFCSNSADVLQLCIGDRCIIIQLGYCNHIPNILRRFLVDQDNTFVGIWNQQDARRLADSGHQLEIGELLDIRHFVTDKWGRSMRRCSFEEIVEECLGHQGVELDPQISMSDWNDYNLELYQILQASIDAYVCSKLGVMALWEE